MNNYKRYPCPCCGFLTLFENTHFTFDICPICNWEDDYVQFNDPDWEGGANDESLNQSRQNYKKFGATSLRHLKDVRAPLPEEIPPKTIRQRVAFCMDALIKPFQKCIFYLKRFFKKSF